MTTFYVSPNGSDSASGLSANAAFATLARAQQAMRASASDDTTIVRGGTYYLDNPLTLTAADSGSSFVAAAGETATISGGQPVAGWQRGANGIWTAQVDAEAVDQLTWNGVRQTESRYPNIDPSDPIRGGWLWAGDAQGDPLTTMTFDPADFPAGRAPQPGMTVTAFSENGYATDVLTIESVNGNVMTFTSPANYDLGPRSRYFVSGGAPDQPGEWSFDASTGVVSFLAPAGFDGDGVVASAEKSLIVVDGAADITIKGLAFSDTSAINGDLDTAAIWARDAQGLVVEANRFENVGAGVVLEDESSGNTVTGNVFRHIWSASIKLSTGTSDNTITSNAIDYSNEVFVQPAAIDMENTTRNLIGNNTVSHVPRFGIAEVNYASGAVSGDNTIEYNLVVHSGQATPDVGAIYIYSGENPDAVGDIIRYNRVIDTGGVATTDGAFVPGFEQSSGIYLDDRASYAEIYGNFVDQTTFSGILIHGGVDNSIHDNVLLNNGKYGVSVIAVDGDDPTGNQVYENVIEISEDGSNTIDLDQSDPALIRNNIYYSETGEAPDIADLPLSGFQARGGDLGSIVTTDPGFVDAEAGDYALRTGSIAASRGVDAVRFQNSGTQGSGTLTPAEEPTGPSTPEVIVSPEDAFEEPTGPSTPEVIVSPEDPFEEPAEPSVPDMIVSPEDPGEEPVPTGLVVGQPSSPEVPIELLNDEPGGEYGRGCRSDGWRMWLDLHDAIEERRGSGQTGSLGEGEVGRLIELAIDNMRDEFETFRQSNWHW